MRRIITIRPYEVKSRHIKTSTNVGREFANNFAQACFRKKTVRKTHVRLVRFDSLLEGMRCKRMSVHDGGRLSYPHEKALKVFVAARRFGQGDLKGLKLQRKAFTLANVLLLAPVESPAT
jgi:hypothetical protein